MDVLHAFRLAGRSRGEEDGEQIVGAVFDDAPFAGPRVPRCIVVQDAAELWGGTSWLHFEPYAKHPDALPITLQDHDHPVRYRNIWVRPLPDLPPDERGPRVATSKVVVPATTLDAYVGTYANGNVPVATVTRQGTRLFINPFGHKVAFELVAPERLLASLDADMVVIPGADGDFGVLPNHAPLMSLLRPGVISVYQGDKVDRRLFVAGGFAEVNEQGCTVLAERAEPLEDIPLDSARQDLRDAEEDLGDAKTDHERERLTVAVEVARARVEAAEAA